MDPQFLQGIKQRIRVACQSEDINTLKKLLSEHSNAISEANWFTVEGESPLDWVSTKINVNLISLLLEHGCPPTFLNSRTGLSVLHVRIKMGCLSSVLKLLSFMADPNLPSEGRLDCALHIATKSADPRCLSIIKALALFNANLDFKNASGESPRHLISENPSPWAKEGLRVLNALGALRCPSDCDLLCAEGCEFVSQDPRRNLRKPDLTLPVCVLNEKISGECKILCLDGGGIKGLVLTQILLVLEQKLGRPIREIFNCVAGTSTGGILALGLSINKSVLECQGLYFQLKDKVFCGQKPYSVRLLEEFYQKMFGTTSTLRNVEGIRVMVMATQANTIPPELHIFRNYDVPFPTKYQETVEDGLIWKVAKVTGAAPFYFKMEHHSLIDGGFVSNNPTLDVLTELTRLQNFEKANTSSSEPMSQDYKNLVPSSIVSLGTGIFTAKTNPMMMGVSAKDGLKDNLKSLGCMDTLTSIGCASELIKLILEQASESNGPVVDRAEAWCSSIGVNYLRINPPISKAIDLDEIGDEILVDMMYEARLYMLSVPLSSIFMDNLKVG